MTDTPNLDMLARYAVLERTKGTIGRRSVSKRGAPPQKIDDTRSQFISGKANRGALEVEYKLTRENKRKRNKYLEDQKKAGEKLRKKLRPFLVALLGVGVAQQILSSPNRFETTVLLAKRYNANPGNHSWIDPPDTRSSKFYRNFLKDIQSPRKERDVILKKIEQDIKKSYSGSLQLKLPISITTPSFRKQLRDAQRAVKKYIEETRGIAEKHKELQKKILLTAVKKERNAEYKAIEESRANEINTLRKNMRNSQLVVELTNRKLIQLEKNKNQSVEETEKELKELNNIGSKLNKDREELLKKINELDKKRAKVNKNKKSTTNKKISVLTKFKDKKTMLDGVRSSQKMELKVSQKRVNNYKNSLRKMVGKS